MLLSRIFGSVYHTIPFLVGLPRFDKIFFAWMLNFLCLSWSMNVPWIPTCVVENLVGPFQLILRTSPESQNKVMCLGILQKRPVSESTTASLQDLGKWWSSATCNNKRCSIKYFPNGNQKISWKMSLIEEQHATLWLSIKPVLERPKTFEAEAQFGV